MTRFISLVVFFIAMAVAPCIALALLSAGVEDLFYLVELPLAVTVVGIAVAILPTKD